MLSISLLSHLNLGGRELYALSTVEGNLLYFLDVYSGSIWKLIRGVEDSGSGRSGWHLDDQCTLTNANEPSFEHCPADDPAKDLHAQLEEMVLADKPGGPTSSAFLVIDDDNNTSGTQAPCAMNQSRATSLFVISHDPEAPRHATCLWELSLSPANPAGQNVAANSTPPPPPVTIAVRNQAALNLPCRVQGLGLRGQHLYVIGENREVVVFDRQGGTLRPLTRFDVPTTMSMPRSLHFQHAVVFVIHKPLGCLSSAADYPTQPRGTVYGYAGKAGFPTNLGLVGRLDGDTSGIMVFTNDGMLNDRLLRPLGDVEEGEAVRGRSENSHESGLNCAHKNAETNLKAVEELPPLGSSPAPAPPRTAPLPGSETSLPVSNQTSGVPPIDPVYKSKEYILRLLQGRNRYCINSDGSLNTALFETTFGQPLTFSRYHSEHNVREAHIKVLRHFQDPAFNPHHRDNQGWVIDVQVIIHEGKHKQIRRLAKRAGYHVISLCRTKICGDLLTLDMVPEPGNCKWLSVEQKRQLYCALKLI